MIVLIYLAAIVAANLLALALGPAASVVIAFVFIGLDLTLRDELHTRWAGRGLVWRMALLIAGGGAIAYTLNQAAGPIALASCAAFAAAATADGLIYHAARRWPYLARVNASNAGGALADSLVFPYLAFGGWLPWVVAGQLAAKVAGGALWALVIDTWRMDLGGAWTVEEV